MSAAAYAYLHARVSVLSERLLAPAQFEALVDGEQDAERHLVRAGLSPEQVEDLDHLASVEQTLLHLYIADADILTRPLSGIARELLVFWVRRYELANLKAIIRGRAEGRPPAWLREELLDIGPFATLPVEELLHTEDAAEMLRRLEDTPYADIARQARAMFEERNELFALEAEVDKRYFAGLNKRVNALPPSDQQHLRRLVGAIIDRHNLGWLLRFRFGYGLAPAHTYYLLIPSGQHLNAQLLLSLVQAGGVDDLVRNLPAALRQQLHGADTPASITDALERAVTHIAETILDRTAFSVARAFAYLLLRQHQLRQIRAVIKGRQLRLDRDLVHRAVSFGAAGPIQEARS